jgi:septal ring factor EnvC (AmiA/AmiB activator)
VTAPIDPVRWLLDEDGYQARRQASRERIEAAVDRLGDVVSGVEAERDRLREELDGARAYAEDLAAALRAADDARKAAESGRDRLAEELDQLRATNSRLSDRLTENAVRIAMYRQERDRQRPLPNEG